VVEFVFGIRNGKIPDAWGAIQIEDIEHKIYINFDVKGVEIIIAPLALTIDPVLPNDEHLALLTAVCKKWQKKKTLTKARHSLQLEKYLTKIRSIQDRYRSKSIALGNDPATEITPYESIHLDLLLGLNDNLDANEVSLLPSARKVHAGPLHPDSM
jgi:hypothetical protein